MYFKLLSFLLSCICFYFLFLCISYFGHVLLRLYFFVLSYCIYNCIIITITRLSIKIAKDFSLLLSLRSMQRCIKLFINSIQGGLREIMNEKLHTESKHDHQLASLSTQKVSVQAIIMNSV